MADAFEIFLVCPPGLEPTLRDEAAEAGFAAPKSVAGGVSLQGGWAEVMRANLVLRGATRVLARIGAFRAFHLAQLDKRARKFDWSLFLRPDVPVRVEAATNRRSKIYHAGAAKQRIERALSESHGMTIAEDAPIRLMARIDDNLVTFSLDTSGEPLHRRGHKQALGKAPMRETLAALFLRQCGYSGTEPVVDPMCGSGTFVIEAAERALGLMPGRSRAFAFQHFAGFDTDGFRKMQRTARCETPLKFFGFDRDQGAVAMASANAERAGVSEVSQFTCQPVNALSPPDGPLGLVIVNPPYGARIGNKKLLYGLYGALGGVLRDRFKGWRVGIVTSDTALARATGLPFAEEGSPIPHGGLKIRLFRTDELR